MALTMHSQYLPEKDYQLPHIDLLSLIFDSPLSLSSESTILHAEASTPTNHITKSTARTLTKTLAHIFRSTFGIGARAPGTDTVLCISSNQVLLPTVFFGIIAAGGVYAAASAALTTAELARQISLSRSSLIVASAENADKALSAAGRCGIPKTRVLLLESMGHKRVLRDCADTGRNSNHHNYLESSPSSGEQHLDWDRITDPSTLSTRLIILLYSSGTTGPPKGVKLSHQNLVSEALLPQFVLRDSKKALPLADRKRVDVPYRTVGHLPTAHIAGCQGYFVTPAVAGGTVYWMERFKVDEFRGYCAKYGVTFLSTAPPVYQAIVESSNSGKKDSDSDSNNPFRTLVRAESGAAPLSPALQTRAEEVLGCPVFQRWGLTETTGSVTTMPWGRTDNGTASISPLLPNARLRIVDADDRAVEEGREGEILVKGPMVSTGYFENEEATRGAFMGDGWFRTGDVGVYRGGRVYMVDRIKELIKYKGLQVSPVEVEAHLRGHSGVADVAVVGFPDLAAAGNELPRAYVVKKENSHVTPEELQDYVKANMAYHKQLRGGVVFVQEIPKNGSGKILRRVLRDEAKREARSQSKL